MNTQLNSPHRLVLLILGLSIASIIAAFLAMPGVAPFVIGLLICAVLFLLRPLLLPPGAGATKVRILSIAGIFAIAGSKGLWADLVNTAAKALASDPAIAHRFPWIGHLELSTEPSNAMLIFCAVGIFIVNYFMADASIAGNHPIPLAKEFPEPSFQSKLESACLVLHRHLLTTDLELNWSPEYYTPLEAEVEVMPTAGRNVRKRIVDLQAALRADRGTQTFLVLGDPGSGKSVSLRKLAQDMLAEVGNTGRLPLYINLREWLPSKGQRSSVWSEQSPPTMQELEAFVLENIRARGDIFYRAFIDKYFYDLWQHGRLFFIFDSFDEIPELLDANEESWLINSLSDLLSRFIASNVNSKGILASRVFRRPTPAFLAQKSLEIRPLSEERILEALTRFPAFNQQRQKELFRDRQDLVPIARNPFLMALLGEWVSNHHALPSTQAELYEDYLVKRLDLVRAKIARHKLTLPDVMCGAKQIAQFVFASPGYGLEAPVAVLSDEPSMPHAAAVIDILKDARIARVTTGESMSFAFVHRRFLEYLVTSAMIEERHALPLEHIPTDARGRDAMVLYAQLCSDSVAEGLARLCWKEIGTHFEDPVTRLRAIHSLRFLIDAFRSRPAAVAGFVDELETFIKAHFGNDESLIRAKICLEATGLLGNAESVPILQLAMKSQNSWLRETAFRACRHLPRISPDLQKLINDYIVNLPVREFWSGRKSLIFSLALSDALKGTWRVAVFRKLNLMVSITALILGGLLVPGLALVVYLSVVGLRLADVFLLPSMNRIARFANRQTAVAGKPDPMVGAPFSAYQTIFCVTLFGVVLTPIADEHSGQSFIRSLLWYPFDQIPGQIVIAVLLIVVVASFDWLKLGMVKKAYAWFVGMSRHERLTFVLFLLLIAALMVGGATGLAWLLHSGPPWVQPAMGGLFIVMVGAVTYSFLLGVRDYVQDWLIFRKIEITSRMSRQEIAFALGSVKQDSLRVAIVDKMAELRTIPNGEWPDGFELLVSNDPAITELAKLEERWLKLDR